jgi:hypothetical protein
VTPIDEVERLFRQLVDVLNTSDPDRLRSPIQISEIYQTIIPYRHYRAALGFDTNEDYEVALMRMLTGEGGFATLDPPEVQDALAEEARAVNPNGAAVREYAAARVYLNSGAVRTVTEAHEAYAPPRDPDVEIYSYGDEGDRFKRASDVVEHREPPPPRFDLVGEDTPPEDTPPEDTVAPLPHAAPTTGESACGACGETLPSTRSANYCPFCGRDLQALACTSCGSELESRWRFCLSCGTAVTDR